MPELQPIGIQQLVRASDNANALDAFVNADASTMVFRPAADPIESLDYWRDYMSNLTKGADGYTPVKGVDYFDGDKGDKGEDGSYTLKAYSTYDLMVADTANIPANTSVNVTNDTDTTKNGMYAYNGTAFAKSAYDPLTQSKSYTSGKVDDINSNTGLVIDLSTRKIYSKYANVRTDTWLNNDKYNGYFLNVKAGESYRITANSTSSTEIYLMKLDMDDVYLIKAYAPFFNLSQFSEIPINQSSEIIVTGDYNVLWISHSFDNIIKKPKEVLRLAPFVLNNSIIDNFYKGSGRDVVSSQAIKDLAKSVEVLKSQINDGLGDNSFTQLEIKGLRGAFTDTDHTVLLDRVLTPDVKRVILPLSIGDVLEFSYIPNVGVVLVQHTEEYKGYVLLGQVKHEPSKIRSYKHVVTEAANYSISSYVSGSVKVNGILFDMQTAEIRYNDNRYVGKAKASIRETEEWLAYESTAFLYVNRGDTVRVEGAAKGTSVIWADPGLPSKWVLSVKSLPLNSSTDVVEWVAPERMKVFLQAKVGAKYYIKRAASLKNELLENRKPLNPSDIVGVTLPEKESVFATHLSFILKTQDIDGVENIAITQNLGKTWTYIPNTIGRIVNYHFFTDGTILLSSEKECYWTDDYLTLNKSTILRKDGSPWVQESVNSLNFFGQQNSDKPMFIEGQEVYVWGEYAIGSTTVGVWYTTDYGRTIKRAVDFMGENFGGIVVNARHIHKVYYHAKQETFYVMTGDTDNENMLVKGKYNLTADTWTWEVLGQGHEYKFGNMWCDDYYAYFTTDYTQAEFKNYWGIARVGLKHLNDPSKFRLAWDAKENGWGNGSPYRFIADRNGNKLLFGELYTFGYMMIATKGYDFKRIELNEPTVLSFIIGPNDNGDIYMKSDLYGRGLATNAGQSLTGGTVNITKMLRNAGLVNFMTGEQNIPHLPYSSE